MSVLGAKVALLQSLVMSHHAMLGDPGEPGGVVRRLVGAFTTYGIEALEVAFVGGHFWVVVSLLWMKDGLR